MEILVIIIKFVFFNFLLQVMLKHNFPIEVQRWIIGKRLIENNQLKLSQCGVKTPGHTLYLYLVTARSVGLTRQHYDTQKQLYSEFSSYHFSYIPFC